MPVGTTTVRLSPHPGGTAAEDWSRRRFLGARITHDDPRLRPKGVGAILDTGLDVLVARFAPCVGIAALLWFPVIILQGTILRSIPEVLVFQILPAFLVETLTVVFVCGIVGGELQGQRVPALEALALGLRRFPGMILLGLLMGALTLVGTCACWLPGIALQWLFCVVPAVYVLERRGMGAALSRGIKLVTTGPAFLRWMGWSAASFFMLLPFRLVAKGLTWPNVRQDMEELLSISGLPFDLLAALVVAPIVGVATAYTAVLLTVFYVDLRVRSEGLDLTLRLEGLKSAGAGV